MCGVVVTWLVDRCVLSFCVGGVDKGPRAATVGGTREAMLGFEGGSTLGQISVSCDEVSLETALKVLRPALEFFGTHAGRGGSQALPVSPS